MLGTRDDQLDVFSAAYIDRQFIGEDTLYGFFARHWKQVFKDEDFADLYRAGGRPSTPPSKLAIAFFLQLMHDLSDDATIDATRYDLRFKVALQLDHHEALCAKSTLQSFRTRLIVHDKDEWVLRRTVELAKAAGVIKRKGKGLTIALDTTPVLGAGAVRDTINLIGDAIRQLLRTMAKCAGRSLKRLAREHDLLRFVDKTVSLKGSAGIDWHDRAAVRGFVRELVADADRMLEIARAAIGQTDNENHREAIRSAADLLGELLAQDIDRGADNDTKSDSDTKNDDTKNDDTKNDDTKNDDDAGPRIRKGTAKNRIVSTTDPEMRHGRKSSSVRFEGHKAAIGVDAASGVILDAQVRAGNDTDSTGALETVERIEAAHDITVTRTVGDCAYGDGATRQDFADVDRELVAKVPKSPTRAGQLPKAQFDIDTLVGTVTCPGGHTTSHSTKDGIEQRGKRVPARVFHFDASACAACPLKSQCCAGSHRSIRVHPQEDLLADARVAQGTAHARKQLRKRQKVEHRIARLKQLGMRHARYRGRRKTALQLRITAALANLTLVVAAVVGSGLGLRMMSRIAAESLQSTTLFSILVLLMILMSFGRLTSRPPRLSDPSFRPDF